MTHQRSKRNTCAIRCKRKNKYDRLKKIDKWHNEKKKTPTFRQDSFELAQINPPDRLCYFKAECEDGHHDSEVCKCKCHLTIRCRINKCLYMADTRTSYMMCRIHVISLNETCRELKKLYLALPKVLQTCVREYAETYIEPVFYSLFDYLLHI